MANEGFEQRVGQIHGDLSRYTYYQLLNLPQNAAEDQIRASFHRMAMSLHPDRHAKADPELRSKIYEIYKRITEGYRVLMDLQLRREYDALVEQGQTRYVMVERRRAPKRPEDEIQHAKAKRFYQLGEDLARRGDKKNALMNLRLAQKLEPTSTLIQKRIHDLEIADS